jgi:hypothetical protein
MTMSWGMMAGRLTSSSGVCEVRCSLVVVCVQVSLDGGFVGEGYGACCCGVNAARYLAEEKGK